MTRAQRQPMQTAFGETLRVGPGIVSGLPPGAREAVIEAIGSGLTVVFLVAAGAAAAAFFLSLLLPERPLRQDVPGS